ncbi:DNA-binding transcriptional regulator KdgR [Alginatibacterium sediminis]|uniref:DNA-binding transcriptional regulator KdgR n=1 Tax=Alginatibacterium sediminis TaxID=2164068 RepID=A0A420ELH5_9ALTE|nr:DNA-binding transcriptional regulator KdgR [Alginatibacterium sediminis]RKF21538.1 DNA-binding transcriptional regulator KdgR [Alginatibacterium sediminis]
MNETSSPDSVSSVIKVFGILQTLGEVDELGVTELAQSLSMSKATVYRFLQTMKQLGFVQQNDDGEKYRLSPKLFQLGCLSLKENALTQFAHKHMLLLAQQTKETVHLGCFDDDAIVYVDKIDSAYSLRMHSRIGRRNPLHTTAIGKVLIAFQDLDMQALILSQMRFEVHTPNTISKGALFAACLDQVKLNGYAEDNEEQELGIRCIAVPIFDRFGVAIAGLSVSYPTIRFDSSNKQQVLAQMFEHAAQISLDLGFDSYPNFGSE